VVAPRSKKERMIGKGNIGGFWVADSILFLDLWWSWGVYFVVIH